MYRNFTIPPKSKQEILVTELTFENVKETDAFSWKDKKMTHVAPNPSKNRTRKGNGYEYTELLRIFTQKISAFRETKNELVRIFTQKISAFRETKTDPTEEQTFTNFHLKNIIFSRNKDRSHWTANKRSSSLSSHFERWKKLTLLHGKTKKKDSFFHQIRPETKRETQQREARHTWNQINRVSPNQNETTRETFKDMGRATACKPRKVCLLFSGTSLPPNPRRTNQAHQGEAATKWGEDGNNYSLLVRERQLQPQKIVV